MTRVVSGAVLIVLAVAIVWAAPDWLFFSAALLIVILGARELVTLARASALAIVDVPAFVAAAPDFSGTHKARIDIIPELSYDHEVLNGHLFSF